MLNLLLILTAIALLDSLSMVPLSVLPMTVAMGSARPWSTAWFFVLGVFTAYLLCGIPLLLGAEVLIEHFGAYLERLWNRPNAVELLVQILIGALLIPSALNLWRSKKGMKQEEKRPDASPWAMFVLGGTLVVIGIPGAVPYLAGIERIVHFDPHWVEAFGFLVFYNVVFILPLAAMIGVRYLLAEQAEAWFQALAKFCIALMPRLTAALFGALGLVLVADGIGWFLGSPLLPVSK